MFIRAVWIRKRRHFFYLDELEAIIREWSAVVYHHRPHDSLVDPHVSGLRMSPAAMFSHGVERAGYICRVGRATRGRIRKFNDPWLICVSTSQVQHGYWPVTLRHCRGPTSCGSFTGH